MRVKFLKSFLTGHNQIDAEHRRIVDLINEVALAMERGNASTASDVSDMIGHIFIVTSPISSPPAQAWGDAVYNSDISPEFPRQRLDNGQVVVCNMCVMRTVHHTIMVVDAMVVDVPWPTEIGSQFIILCSMLDMGFGVGGRSVARDGKLRE